MIKTFSYSTVTLQSLANTAEYTCTRMVCEALWSVVIHVGEGQGQKPEGCRFKLCSGHLILCVVSLDNALYLHCLSSPCCDPSTGLH